MSSVKFVAFRGQSWISKAIRFVTRSPSYSHVGFLTGMGTLIECWPNPQNRFQRWCISSFDFHRAGTEYEVWELPCSQTHMIAISKFITQLAIKNTKYDWIGVLAFVFKRLSDADLRWFCSEGCVAPLVKAFKWTKVNPSHISPQNFVELIQVAGAKCIKEDVV